MSNSILGIVATIVGGILLLCGIFLFFVFTVDMTSNIRIAGPMNLWPPPLWIYLVADAVFASFAILGMKLTGLKRRDVGFVMSLVGVLVLVWVVNNQLHAPPRDVMSDGRYLPADIENYVTAYVIAGTILLAGVWLVIQHFRSRSGNVL